MAVVLQSVEEVATTVHEVLKTVQFNHGNGTQNYIYASPTDPLTALVTFLYVINGSSVTLRYFHVHPSLRAYDVETAAIRQFLSGFPPSTTIEMSVSSEEQLEFFIQQSGMDIKFPVNLSTTGVGVCMCRGLANITDRSRERGETTERLRRDRR